MFSIKGVFKNNTIHLLEPLKIKEKTNVIVTFIDDNPSDNTEILDEEYMESGETEISADDLVIDDEEFEDESVLPIEDNELSEEYYSKIRKHKRYIANGNISLIEGEREMVYPLFDYSAGGLSFISDKRFDVGISLTASIKDPIEQDMSVLDFEFEVARTVDFNGKFKIGCKFFDEVDEEIWHSLMG